MAVETSTEPPSPRVCLSRAGRRTAESPVEGSRPGTLASLVANSAARLDAGMLLQLQYHLASHVENGAGL